MKVTLYIGLVLDRIVRKVSALFELVRVYSNAKNLFPITSSVSFPQLEELISPHMCRPKPRISINEEKQVVDVLYISSFFSHAICIADIRIHKNIIKGIKRTHQRQLVHKGECWVTE